MRVILEDEGEETLITENASLLEVNDDGLLIGTMFEEPQFIQGAIVRSIDFLSGRVIVTQKMVGR